LSCDFVKIQVCRDRSEVVDISGRARQAVEEGQDESADAMEFERFGKDTVQFRGKFLPWGR
jgi:hypothetical protein